MRIHYIGFSMFLILNWAMVSSAHALNESYHAINTPRGATVPVWLIETAGAKANVILFAGGKGKLKISSNGIRKKKNFLVRSRELFANAGFNVLVIDKPDDVADLFDLRTGADHANDILAVMQFLVQRSNLPVWLIGTSRGTISVVNVAARYPAHDNLAGIVLTASVLSGNRDTIHNISLENITAPTLFVHNQNDQCHVSQYSDLSSAMAKFVNVKDKALQTWSSTEREQNKACKALTPHGFLGLEDKVVRKISDWIKSRP